MLESWASQPWPAATCPATRHLAPVKSRIRPLLGDTAMLTQGSSTVLLTKCTCLSICLDFRNEILETAHTTELQMRAHAFAASWRSKSNQADVIATSSGIAIPILDSNV